MAEAMALIKATVLMPENAAVWTDSKVAKGWMRHARRGWPISVVLLWLMVVKCMQVLWLPMAWNPANQYTRMEPSFMRRIGHCARIALGGRLTPHECLKEALDCREFSEG